MNNILKFCLVFLFFNFFSSAFADIDRVRVINQTPEPIFVHVGGFAPATKIEPGQWKIFTYPFQAISPSSAAPTDSSLLVVSAGGHWATNEEGFTELKNPSTLLCLDYKNQEYQGVTGNRKWTIKQLGNIDENCSVKGYQEPWANKQ